jgi:DNA-binding GntR family transcriptional regulator
MSAILYGKRRARPDAEPSQPAMVAADDPLAEQISQEIERDIIFGRLTPGRKLREEELSQRFSASRHQVREALARLIRIGIVTKERNKGVSVRHFGTDEVRQIYEIREILQRQAALRIPLPVTGSSMELLESIHRANEHAVRVSDLRGIHESNDRFHTELFGLCGNDILSQLVKQFMDLSYVIRANAFNTDHAEVALKEHRLMLGLLKTTDSWALSQLCVDHIQYSKNQYLAFLAAKDCESEPVDPLEEGARIADVRGT